MRFAAFLIGIVVAGSVTAAQWMKARRMRKARAVEKK